jgi:hypothetical protein
MHTLYRFYDAQDALLYVGLTCNPGKRLEQHRDTKEWWAEVARIGMEQHPDLETLRAAERATIKAEKPLYNIRMNGAATASARPPQPVKESVATEGLVGRWFHSWRPARDDDSEYATKRGDRVLVWQGEVLERIEHELYLIETYSWWDGSPYSQELISVRDMDGWTFYSSNVEMIAALGCRENWRDNDGPCGAHAEYLTSNFGLGTTGVCDHCAGYYSAVYPIVWHNGKATLGAKTTVPHPLSDEGRMRR